MDTENLILRLPGNKLSILKETVREWLTRKSCSVRELQSLAGKLQHACKVVRPGRTFLRRIFELLKGCGRCQTFVYLNAAFRSDLTWWHLFLDTWNGVDMMDNPANYSSSVDLYADASGRFGCAAWCGCHWLQVPWWDAMGKWSIAAKELIPTVLASMLWGSRWQGCLVIAHCDNLAVVEVINAGYCKDPQLMQLLRCLFFVLAHHKFSLKAIHIPGKLNVEADAISRNKLNLFFTGTRSKQASNSDTRGPSGSSDSTATDWTGCHQTGPGCSGLV